VFVWELADCTTDITNVADPTDPMYCAMSRHALDVVESKLVVYDLIDSPATTRPLDVLSPPAADTVPDR
jgi:hypothetical protein